MLVSEALNNDFDLIVLDLDTQYQRTLTTARELTAKHFKGALVGISNDLNQIDRNACLDAGLNTCIQGPLKKEVALQVIRNLCSN